MIAIICAMKEERDALLKHMEDIREEKGKELIYHGEILDNEYYIGTMQGKEVLVCRSGVGHVYATIGTVELIEKYEQELIINLGCAGSLNEKVHVGDVVIADSVSHWRIDVPGWERSIASPFCSFKLEEKILSFLADLPQETNIHVGPVVSADEFIYKKEQVEEIKKNFPEALCGEMEGYAIASTAYAYRVPCNVIRSISDETLISGSFLNFEFNLNDASVKAADLCKEIIKRY